MKKSLLVLISLVCAHSILAQNSTQPVDFNSQDDRAFVQNDGQFENRNWKNDEILYAMDENPFYIFFTKKGITYRFDKIVKNKEHQKGNPDSYKRTNISELVHATWVGSNADVVVTAEDVTDHYYSYAVREWPTKEVKNIQNIRGFKKITYTNLYDNIDVEYILHPDGGIKYSVILHPGADPSLVQLEYSSAHTNTENEAITIELDAKGEMAINTSLGGVVEHAPYTFEKDSKREIDSKYKFENNILSFELGAYDPSKEVIIDPWNISPAFTTSTAVWEVESDGAGNVYTIGGETPMELKKYSAAGALIWTYVTPWDTNSVWLGTMATDDVGNTYITSGTSPEIEKVNNAGAMQYHTNGTGLSTEYWSITFNCDKTKLIVGGTGGGLFSWDATIYDIDITNGNVLASQIVGNQGGLTPVEVRSISSSKNAKYIYLTHNEAGAINQNIGSCPSDAPYFEVDNGHNLGYKCENYLPATQNGGGLKALVSNDNFFYTHSGDEVHQRNLTTGALITTVALAGGNSTNGFGGYVVDNSGLAVDDCGNVYAGSGDRVVKFDQNLNFISQSMTGFTVYDVSVNANGEVLAVGAELDNGSVNRNGHLASFAMAACAQYSLVCCDASICPQDTLCENDPAVNLFTTTGGGTFAGTGITDVNLGTFDPSVSGSGIFTVTYTQLCGSDQIDVVVSPCVNLTACLETNGDITMTSGVGPYDWDEEVITQDCSGCIIGCNFPAGCAVDVTSWSYFISGTTVTPPSFPLQVTDGVGGTIIITDPALLPACSVGCDATITPAGPFCQTDAAVILAAVDVGGTWTGTGITNGTTGTFDPATAGAGIHTITYTLICGDVDTEDITVLATDDPSFTYPAGSYCTTDTDPTPTITGLGGGTFSIDGTGVINASTGIIDLDASGVGAYIVTYLTNGPCPTSTTFNITITSNADATITAAGPFCETDAAVILTAVTGGGTWTGTGITNGATGAFDPATAGPGAHLITYTITGSCGDVDTETITVNATDDPSFSYPQGSYCLTDPDPIATVTGLGGGTFSIDGTGVINATTGLIDIGGSGAGSYIVTYLTNGPCPTSTTFGVTLTTGANATITAAGPFCESDAAVNLTAVDGGGTWTGTGITNGTTGTFDPATAGPGTHTITYTITGSCGAVDTEDITVNADDDPSFSYTAGSFCLTDPDPLATVTGTGGGTFTIDGTGVINAATGLIDIAGSGAGSYVVTYTTNGVCPQSTTFNVTLTSGADATITAAGPFCETDGSVILTAVDGGGTWTGTGITNGTTGAFDPATAGPGVHTITYTITGSCGDVDTEDITVNATDDPSFSYTAGSFCLTDPDPLATVTGLGGGTFSIDGTGVINATTGLIDIAGSGAGSYIVTYLTNGPCPTSTTFNVTLTSGANATITAAGPFCETDASVNLTAVDGGGTWTGTGITNGTTGTFDPATAGPGTHTITYTITGSCGDVDTEDIVVNATDDASFSYALAAFCISDPDPSPTITGLAGGTFSIDNGGTINSSTGVVDLDNPGNGAYVVTYTTNGPCPTSATFNLTITNSLDATITAAGPFCENDAAVNLTAIDGGGTWTGTGITDANLGTFDPSVAGVGSHNITYTIAGACGSTDNINITVNAADVASFSYPNGTYCTSDTDPAPSITGTLGGTFTIDNAGVINPTTGVIDLAGSGTGTYTVTYTTGGTCPDVATFIVTISDGGSPVISPAGPFCETDGDVVLTASVGGGTWSGTGITDPNTGAFSPSTAGPGTHTITYTTAGTCGTATTIDIVVSGVPVAVVDGPFTISYGQSVQITASGGTSYTWIPTTDLSCSDCPDPTASPLATTTYCVVVSNGSCTDTACTTVTVDFDCGEIYVPTAFTPQSDDLNNMECVMGGACIEQIHFRIYDRWGELVFETFDQTICWDGTHRRNAKKMSSGVYVYILDATLVTGEQVNKKGNISLIR